MLRHVDHRPTTIIYANLTFSKAFSLEALWIFQEAKSEKNGFEDLGNNLLKSIDKKLNINLLCTLTRFKQAYLKLA